ncbi:MAG: acyltransferase domain-containing protein, partial [Chromatiales bacterium]
GDPIEFAALDAVYGKSGDTPCPVGAFKSQIGHLEAAAGIAGLVKAALVIERGTIPANLHFERPNDRLPLAGSRLLPAARPASLTPEAPLAGLSSFGFGGTNAHVIVGPAPDRQSTPDDARDRPTPPGLLVFSARDRDALRALAQAHADRVAALGTDGFRSYCRSAALGRSHLPYRAAVVATDGAGAAKRIRDWLDGTDAPAVFAGELAPGATRPRLAFLYTGQGASLAGAGRDLLAQQPVFREAMARADDAARSEAIGLVAALDRDAAMDRAPVVQPTQFAFAHGLAALWTSWGITPDAVLGHSLGEYAAACMAGTLDAPEAVRALIARGRLAEERAPPGAMLAVRASAGELSEIVSELEVRVAVDNGPRAATLAGAPGAIAQAQERIEAKGLKCTRLDITHAFHHPAMAPVADGLAQHLRETTLRAPTLPYFSSITGRRETDLIARPGYWADQVTSPVHFAEGLRALSGFGCDLYLEIGPAPVLTRLGGTILPDRPARAFIESLRPGAPAPQVLAEALARLYVAGARPDWNAVFRGAGSSTVTLPRYPFQRRRHWLPEQCGAMARMSALAQPLETASRTEAIFAAGLDPRTSAYLADHRVNGRVIAPGATMISLAAQVGRHALGPDRSISLAQVRFVAPLELIGNEAREVQLVTAHDLPGSLELMARQADGAWTCHFTAELGAAGETTGAADLAMLRAACTEALDPDAIYAALGRARLDYGPALRRFGEIWLGDRQCLARLETIATAGAGPVEIDACFQALGALLPEASAPLVPAFADRIVVGPGLAGGTLWCHVAARSEPGADPRFDLRLLAEGTAEPVLSVDGLTLCPLTATPRAATGAAEGLLHRMRWLPEPLPARPEADLESIGTSLTEGLDDPANRRLHTEWSALDSELERVSHRLASRVLAVLTGGADDAGMDAAAIGREARVAPGFERLLARLCELAREAGPGSAAVSAEDPFADLVPAVAEAPEMRLLRHVADHIPQVLRGTADPLALLFGEQDGGLAAALYRGSAGLELMNRLVADGVKTLAQARTGDEPLSVLEIGGGTGATTQHVLDALSGRPVDYLFTDVSAAFLAQASDGFAAQDGFSTAVLDIERDPSAQGLVPAARDCVIAANVLHATQDLAQTLRHVRSLIAPGGVLMLVEGTRKRGFSDITFGLTSGWWRFTDHDLRTDHPLLSEDGWRGVLARSGFDAVEVVSPGGPDGEPLGQSLILARAAQPARRTRWLILADRGGTGPALADALGDHGEGAVLGDASDETLGVRL